MSGASEKGEGGTQEVKSEAMAIVVVSSPACIQARSIGASLLSRNSAPPGCTAAPEEINHARTLMPVNIKQIADAWMFRMPDFIVINNTAATSLKIIGRVAGKKVDEYKGNFTINDGTGIINASMWFTYGREELDRVSEGDYAMVVGKIKLDGPSPEMLCYCCRPVTNFNDITHHHLSVIATHIDLVLKPAKSVHERVAEMWQADKAASAHHGAAQFAQLPERPIAGMICSKEDELDSVSKVECKAEPDPPSTFRPPTTEAIMNVLRDEFEKVGPGGVHIDHVCSKLRTNKNNIRAMIDELAMAGELYTTVDCDHLAPT